MEEINDLIHHNKRNELRNKLNDQDTIDKLKKNLKNLVRRIKNSNSPMVEAIIINKIPDVLENYSELETDFLIKNLISELSEEIYSSGWNENIEFELWTWGTKGLPRYLDYRIEQQDLIDLIKLGKTTNKWATWIDDKAEEEKIIQLNEFIEIYNSKY